MRSCEPGCSLTCRVPRSLAMASQAHWQQLRGRLRWWAEEAQFAPAAAVADGEEEVGVFDGLALLAQA